MWQKNIYILVIDHTHQLGGQGIRAGADRDLEFDSLARRVCLGLFYGVTIQCFLFSVLFSLFQLVYVNFQGLQVQIHFFCISCGSGNVFFFCYFEFLRRVCWGTPGLLKRGRVRNQCCSFSAYKCKYILYFCISEVLFVVLCFFFVILSFFNSLSMYIIIKCYWLFHQCIFCHFLRFF